MGLKTVTTSATVGTLQAVECRRTPTSSLGVLSVKLGISVKHTFRSLLEPTPDEMTLLYEGDRDPLADSAPVLSCLQTGRNGLGQSCTSVDRMGHCPLRQGTIPVPNLRQRHGHSK